eukprot:gene31741-40009_t
MQYCGVWDEGGYGTLGAGVTLPLAAAQSQGNAETAKPAKPA